jgi:hypothetical protein
MLGIMVVTAVQSDRCFAQPSGRLTSAGTVGVLCQLEPVLYRAVI